MMPRTDGGVILPPQAAQSHLEVRAYQSGVWGALTGKLPDGTPVERKDRIICICHRRWGKDEMALHGAFVRSQQEVGAYWHCLPEYEQARKIIWEQVGDDGLTRVQKCFPAHAVERYDTTRMFVKFKNGSTWQLIGSDKFDKNVGAGPKGIVFSEFALSNPVAWGVFRPMIQESKGWAMFITTPRGENHAKRMYDAAVAKMQGDEKKALAEAEATNEEETKEITANSWHAEFSNIYDTGAVTIEEAYDSLHEYGTIFDPLMAKLLFEQEYECSFEGIEHGSYWGAYLIQAEQEGRVYEFDIDRRFPIHTAWDLGAARNNPMWVFQVKPMASPIEPELIRPCPVIIDYYQPLDMSDLGEWCDWLCDRGYDSGVAQVPHDALQEQWGTGRTRIDIMKDHGLRPVEVPRTKLASGISAGAPTIKRAHFRATKRVKEGIKLLKGFKREWDHDMQTYKDLPKKDNCEHAASAFRYLCLAWKDRLPKREEREVTGLAPEVWRSSKGGGTQCSLSLREQVFRQCGMKLPVKRVVDSRGRVRNKVLQYTEPDPWEAP